MNATPKNMPTAPDKDVTAIVLAGGQGKRMGSVDKGLQPFKGKPFIAHVLEKIACQAGTILISANRHLTQYQAYGYPVYPDTVAGFPGPLAGFLTGLTHCQTPYLATAPCDTPFLHDALIKKLKTALIETDADIAVATTMEAGTTKLQSVFTVMKSHLAPSLAAYLKAGNHKLGLWFDTLKTVTVPFAEKEAFININTLAELNAYQLEPANTNPSEPMMDTPKPDRLSVTEAQERILAAIPPTPRQTENIPLLQAQNRILAKDLASPIDVPTFNSAAMDGFAFEGKTYDLSQDLQLKVVGHSYAGHPFTGQLKAGECIEIMTGAMVPGNCDTVVQQEDVQFIGDKLLNIPAGSATVQDNIRTIGENIQQGAPLLKAGTRLKPTHLGLLASAGMATVPVYTPPTVAVFSTGDELCPMDGTLADGQIYDSNRAILMGLAKDLGCPVLDLGIVSDNPEKLEAVLTEAAKQADVIITSGGVSVGAADYMKQVMAQLGGIGFWSVKMRPGRPMAFGKVKTENREALLFGLPGNPVAATVSFLFFVKNALLKMMGAQIEPPQAIAALAKAPIRKKTGRTEFQRGIVNLADGQFTVSLTGSQGSGVIQSLTDANCIIYLPEDQGMVKAGDRVTVYMLDELL
jgi:molybdopterin molybdotransferase